MQKNTKATNLTAIDSTIENSQLPTGATRDGEMVDVLYQKMGDRWYAFSLIDDEVFFGSLTADEIHQVETRSAAISTATNDANASIADPTESAGAVRARRQRGNA